MVKEEFSQSLVNNSTGIEFHANNSVIDAHTVGSYNINTAEGNVNVTYVYHEGPSGPAKLKIIAWLRSSSNDYRLIHDNVYSNRAPNTGKWFLESTTYILWVNSEEQECRNLECTGMPGAGKTSLASAVIEDLEHRFASERDKYTVLYAYFRHDSQKSQTVPIVFANLLSQIVQRQRAPSKGVMDLYDDYSIHGEAIPRLDKVTLLLQSEIAQYRRVYIVIDALDEYIMNDYASSYTLVRQLQLLKAKLLITSRHSVGFALSTFSQLPVYASMDDIHILIQEQLNGRLAANVRRSPGLLQEIVEKISAKSQGMFLIARFLIDWISGLMTPKAIRSALEAVPVGLEATYRLTMERVGSQSDEVARIGISSLSWALNARRSLTIKELQHAVSLQPGMTMIDDDDLVAEEDILSACAGLLVVVDVKGRRLVQFVHFSTKEFLEKFSEEYFPGAQRNITEECLRYLCIACANTPEAALQRISQADADPDDEIEKIVEQFPFLDYAAPQWGRHAFGIKEEFDHQLAADLFQHTISPYLISPWETSVHPVPGISTHHYRILHSAAFGLVKLLELYAPPPNAARDAETVRDTFLDPRAQTNAGKGPMHIAAFEGHPEIIKLLIQHGADVHTTDGEGRTSLIIASASGRVEVVRILLANGADPNTLTRLYSSSLSFAVTNTHIEIVRMLLEHGADANIRGDRSGSTPLYYAIAVGSREMVRMLLEKGADTNVRDQDGWTPLFFAAADGQVEVVKLLLENGADAKALNLEGRSALSYAEANGHAKVVETLRDKEQ